MDRLSFTLQSVTSFLRLRLHNYYGFICHLTSLRSASSFLLRFPICFQNNVRFPQLFRKHPVNCSILTHSLSLTTYWALRYFARLPTQTAVSGSLPLCAVNFLLLPSDPAEVTHDNALAIRIVFPMVWATPVSYNMPGLLTLLGKQKASFRFYI